MLPVPLRDVLGSTHMRSPLALPAAAALLLGACTYDFSNPAEELDSGEITGRVVVDVSGSLQPLAGVTVRLRNSFDGVTTRANGKFFLLGLQPGRHVVQFEKTNLIPTDGWAITREVEVTWGSDGQPEGVIIGDVQVRYPVNVGGTLLLPASAVANGFTWLTSEAVDEVTGARGSVFPGVGPNSFDFQFTGLPVGPHRFRIAVGGTEGLAAVPTSYALGPIDWDIAVSQERSTIPIPPATGTPATGFGKLRFQVVAPPALTSTFGYTATVTRSGAAGAPELCTAYSDGTRECDLAAGVYSVDVVPGGGAFSAPTGLVGIVSADLTTDLGTIYVTDDTVTSRADLACLVDADCGAGSSCSGGQCTVPACLWDPNLSVECTSWDAICFSSGTTTPCMGGAGICQFGPTANGLVCVPNGAMACRLTGEPAPIQAPDCRIN
jgi:hypothetical protein